MTALFGLFEEPFFAFGIYILAGGAALINLMLLLRARYRLRIAQFMLERELAERQGGYSFTRMVFAIQVMVAVWGINALGAPEWRAGLPEEELETDFSNFVTSTPAGGSAFNPADGFQIQDDGITIPQTAPPPSTPSGTIIPSQERRNCVLDRAWIEYPDNGMVVFEAIPIRGTANIENFAFYRFEIRAAQPGENFAPIGGVESDYQQPVRESNGVLGQFTPYNFLPGEYRLRMVVFDTNNEAKANCEITIHIMEPIPSPTPQF
jgi:hypothetical protein